jgi:gliding motility-associated-like protein
MKNRIILIFLAFIFCHPSKIIAQNGCVEIQTILVAACLSNTSNFEGYNEMITFKTGSTPLNANNLAVNWSSGQNVWQGALQNSITAAKVAEINSTILACGLLKEPVNGVIPANSRVIVFSSYLVGATNNSFANVSDTLIAIFQNDNYTAGHFLNYVENQVIGYLQTTNVVFTNQSGCSDNATYNRNLLVKVDGTIGNEPGASVNFTIDGTPTYFNNGCQAPIQPISANWTAPQAICQLDAPINLNQLITGTRGGVWTGSPGITDSIFNPAGLSGQVSITYTVSRPVTCNTLPPLSESHTINILQLGNASWVGPDTVCSSDLLISLTPYVTGQPNGIWSGNGVSGSSWNVVALSGSVPLTYSVGQGNCLAQVTKPIVVTSLAPLVLSGTNQYCSGATVLPITTTASPGATVTWYSNPGLTTQVGSGLTYTPSSSASATYYAIQTQGSCSSLPISFQISTVAEPAIPQGDTLVNYCEGSPIPQLTVNSSDAAFWYSDSALANQVSTGNTYTPPSPEGTFWVIAKIGDCSGDPLVIDLVLDTVPTVSISVTGGNSLCFSDSIILSSASPIGNVWSNNETTQSIVVKQPGIYFLTRQNGCDTVTTQELIVGLPVFADFTVDADTGLVEFEVTITDLSQNADQCFWYLDDSLLSVTSLSNLSFLKKGEYDLTHICTNSEGCNDTVTLKIVALDNELKLEVPNVFSPNADQINDQFRVKYNAVKTFQAIVYNRWGKKMYEWTDVAAGWDGTSNGNEVPEGVYFYVITATDLKDKVFDKKGSVTLLRN